MRKHCNKVVLENFFEPCVLYLLLKKPSYGYEIIRNLKENCGCDVNVGNLYRGLAKLQKNGNIIKRKLKSKIGPDKFVYQIAPKGQQLLKEWIEELGQQKALINKLIINYQKSV